MSNLVKRSVSGIVFLALVITALLWRAEAYFFIFLFFIGVMMSEYLNISIRESKRHLKDLAIGTGAIIFIVTYWTVGFGVDLKWFCIVPLMLTVTVSSVLFSSQPDNYKYLPYLLTSVVYIAIPFSMCHLIVFTDGTFNALPLLAVLILLWSSDVGAYVFGMTLRNIFPQKLCPAISPKKTVIGYVGGLAVTLLAGYLLSSTGMLDCGTVHSLVIALIVNITGTIGDLAESQFKRHFDVKDSGRIMPGHGGLLDRFDGALLAFPASISYLILIS